MPGRYSSIGPALAFTLFDGGLKRSQVRQAEAVCEQNVANYRQTVLTAFQDVEDYLISLRLLADEVLVQDEVVRAAEESLMHALNQYKAGTVSYLNVITAQASALSSRNTALGLLGRRLNSSMGLVKPMVGLRCENRRAGRTRADHIDGIDFDEVGCASFVVSAQCDIRRRDDGR